MSLLWIEVEATRAGWQDYQYSRADPDDPYHEMTREEFGQGKHVWWHGSPNGKVGERIAAYGLHIGTHEAARQALHARMGAPYEGEWDGTREYGKTLLNRDYVWHQFNPDRSWTHHVEHHEPSYPSGHPSYSTGDLVPHDAKPDIKPMHIIGPMTNTPDRPHDDFPANGYMKGQITKGVARRGYFYRNIGEDEGSISAVLPSRSHVKTHGDYVRAAHGQGLWVPGHNLDRYGLR